MKTALLLIDIQNDYFQNGKMPLVESNQACEKASLLLDRFRRDGLPVIHIQHIATRPDASFFLQETFGVEIHKNLKPLKDEKIIIKHYPNSFRGTELLDYLKSRNILNLVICGMMTHMRIDSTARAAKDFGFQICLIEDACATKDLEINGEIIRANEVHKSFLAALNYFYAEIKSTAFYLNEN